eukprot:5475237-Prymnesium_polylepis.1
MIHACCWFGMCHRDDRHRRRRRSRQSPSTPPSPPPSPLKAVACGGRLAHRASPAACTTSAQTA